MTKDIINDKLTEVVTLIEKGDYESAENTCRFLLEARFHPLLTPQNNPSKTSSRSTAAPIYLAHDFDYNRVERTAKWCETTLHRLQTKKYVPALQAAQSAVGEWQQKS